MDTLNSTESLDEFSIAIIGMSCRFPGANNLDEFWENLRDGVESVSFFSNEELIAEGIDPDLVENPNYIKAHAIVDDIENFDASFFGFTPREAEVMDPQHRLFLECAWNALENAGYDSEEYDSSIGVFAGAGMNTYLLKNLLSNPELINSLGGLQISIGNDKDFVPTQTSYKLNLTGPSVNVNTACSSSLVAVQVACQNLLNYQCDMALAGGVSVNVPQKEGYLYQEGSIVSPDGHCRAFDANAKGCIDGSGTGIVILKRLQDALADGDNISAIIRGSAINNDGSLKVGYTAPSIEGQSGVISEAQAVSGIDVETISYVETHGTGTILGDPIEVAALTQAFRHNTQKKGFCGIGSVKTNIGHLGAAAGIASLIKTVLALKHKQIPPSLNFDQPNPKIDFANSPFYVVNKLSEWETDATPRRAGVSSFGIGGTNAHLVLEEAPTIAASQVSRPYHILHLSAKTSSALEIATANLVTYLKQHPDSNLADVAYTLQVGRQDFKHRRAVVCKDIADAVVALEDPKRVKSGIYETSSRPIAFMFTGVGTQYVNMTYELYQVEPVFRENIDLCCEIINPLLGEDIRDILYSKSAQVSKAGLDLRKMLGRDLHTDVATAKLNQTRYTQPIMFAVEYALAQLWQSWGIQPESTVGYSIGEYVAATLAGVFSLEEALKLVVTRALMIEELPPGAMLAVPLSEAEVRPLLNEQLSISAINGEKLCVLAGDTQTIEKIATDLNSKGLVCRRLQTSHAFHSHMMEPLAEVFTEMLQTFDLQPPSIPFVSNVTGTWITPEEATDANYWTKHLCKAVRFADGVSQLWKTHNPILLEVGPGQTLGSLALQCLDENIAVLPSLSDSYNQQSDVEFLLNQLSKLWLWGVEVDYSRFYANQQLHRIALPTYPFERQRYWVEAKKHQLPTTDAVPVVKNIVRKKSDITDWFYVPSWKRSGNLIVKDEICKSPWLVFVDEHGLGDELVKRLKDEGAEVIVVRASLEQTQSHNDKLQILGAELYINPQQSNDYDTLVKYLLTLDNVPRNIVHLWSVTPNISSELNLKSFNEAQDKGYYSLLFLTQALSKHNYFHKVELTVVSSNIQEVTGEEVVCPEKATLQAAIKVIPQEYRNITCQSIDIILLEKSTFVESNLIDKLLREVTAKSSEMVVAYRGNHRWVQHFEPVALNQSQTNPNLRNGGVYLITGGLGGVGLVLAEHLAKTVQAKLILTGRSAFPTPLEWEQWLANHNEDDTISQKIHKLRELEKLGAEVLVKIADVADREQMQTAIASAEEKFGQINGVIHAAGVVGGNSMSAIAKISKADCEVQFRSKVYGTLVLEEILRHKVLDFCMVTSSLSAILGGLEFFGYAAANVFLDAFIRRLNQKDSSKEWICINWEDWNLNNNGTNDSLGATVANLNITVEEGLQAFDKILSLRGVNQLILSTGDLQARINQWVKLDSPSTQPELQHSGLSHNTRPNLANAYVAPSSQIEQQLANIWQEFLGIDKVGIYDNFFELGGHSLLGTQVISRMREIFAIDLPLRALFEQPTIADIAKFIETNNWVIQELQSSTDSTIDKERVQLEL